MDDLFLAVDWEYNLRYTSFETGQEIEPEDLWGSWTDTLERFKTVPERVEELFMVQVVARPVGPVVVFG